MCFKPPLRQGCLNSGGGRGGGGFSGKSLVVGGVGVGERSERGGFWSVVFSGSWVMKGFERALFSSSLSSSSSSSVFPSSPTHSLSAPPPPFSSIPFHIRAFSSQSQTEVELFPIRPFSSIRTPCFFISSSIAGVASVV